MFFRLVNFVHIVREYTLALYERYHKNPISKMIHNHFKNTVVFNNKK